MIAIMIDRKLERFDDVIKYTFAFIFDTLGFSYRFIKRINELQRNEIIFFYGLLEPSKDEKNQFTNNPTVFFIKAEIDLLTTGRINREELTDKLQEIKLYTVIPILCGKEFQYPLITYKVNEVFWGQFNFDIIGNIFFHLSGYEETMSQTRDMHGNIADGNLPLIGYKSFPYVNALLWMIENFLVESISSNPTNLLIKKEYWPENEGCAFALSHNIDTLQKWRVGNLITSLFRDLKLLVIFKWTTFFRNLKEKINYLITNYEVYWNFDEIREIVREHKIRVTYFLSALDKKNHSQDVDYSLKDPDLQAELNQIKEDKSELALLATYNSQRNEKLGKQLDKLSNTIGQKAKGIRHDYHQYDNPGTTEIHSTLNITYDSTEALQEKCGFRHGIAFPYHHYHPEKSIDHWELPLSFTDNILQLTNFSILAKERAQTLIKNMVTNIRKTNGLLVFNFSISKFNDIHYLAQLMDFTLRLLKQEKCYSGTLAEIAEWWDARSKVQIKKVEEDIYVHCPVAIDHITLTFWGNRAIKKISGAKGTIKGKSVTLKDIRQGDTITLTAPQDDQLYLDIEDENSRDKYGDQS